MLKKTISGGQTGADVAGVLAAKMVGLATGGTMPRNFITLDGPKPQYAEMFGMIAHSDGRYPPRTEENVKNSDATLCFASDWRSKGELLTRRLIKEYRRPDEKVDVRTKSKTPREIADWLLAEGTITLNVAGNSHLTDPSIGLFVYRFMLDVFEILGLEVLPEFEKAHQVVMVKLQTGIYEHG